MIEDHLIAPKGQISDSQHNMLWMRSCQEIIRKYVGDEFYRKASLELEQAMMRAEQRKSDRVNEMLEMWKLRQRYSLPRSRADHQLHSDVVATKGK